MKTLTIILATIILVVSCDTVKKNPAGLSLQKEESLSVIKTIPGLEIAERTFKINATELSIITLPNGGSIEIQKNSLVDKNGNLIKGSVEVQWQEFHSLTDIMLSGIPMKYDSSGVSYDFVSGGMFTISATQKNHELEIRSGNKISVNIASPQEETKYSFFQLNEKTGAWSYDTTATAKPITKVEVETAFTIIDAQVDLTNFPELKHQDIVAWKSTDRLSKRELKAIKENAAVVTLEGEKNGYILNFNRKNQIKKIHVEPYLLSDALKNDKKMKHEIQEGYEELLAFQNNLKEGKVVRSIEIKNFGTYNWDVKNKRENSKNLVAEFDYGTKVKPKFVSVFLVSPDEKMIVRYDSEKDENFSFDPKKKNCLVAILPDNRILAVNDNGFDNARKSPANSKVTFAFEDLGLKVNSGEDLGRKILDIIQNTQ